MRKIFILILIIFALVSSFRIFNIYKEYLEAINYYKEVQSEYIESQTTFIINTSAPFPTSTPISPSIIVTKETAIKPHTTTQKPPISIDFSALRKQNNEIIGWIYSEGTAINYPIMQTSNNIYYLRHLMNKSYSISGSIFLDTINNANFTDDNSILYGHHMRNGSMFASIEKYKKQDYFNAHPYMWLLTPTQNYMLVPFAGLIVEPSRENYFMINFDNEIEQQTYVTYALENSTFVGDFAPNSADKIITLTTCDYTFKDARFILICTLVLII